MRIIIDITIKNFRSLKNVSIPGLRDFNALVGRNNAGKSNVLRALNLFFNHEVEEGVPLDIAKDCSARKSQKKEIEIVVSFDLPSNFKCRSGLENIEYRLGRTFGIKKVWGLGEDRPSLDVWVNPETKAYEENYKQGIAADEFLKLVKFRYIPSHREPQKLIERELSKLQSILVRGMNWRDSRRRKKNEQEKGEQSSSTILTEALTRLNETAEATLRPISDEIIKKADGVRNVKFTAPTGLTELLLKFGAFVELEDGTSLESNLQGSGIQTYLLYHLLHFIDAREASNFGWKQAVIWVLEEPESFLHTDLEADLGSSLFRFSHVPNNRVQIITSTHSELMIQNVDTGYYLELREGRTHISPATPAALLETAVGSGVSKYLHPLLAHRNEPIILVEGVSDVKIMKKVAEELGYSSFRFISLGELDNTRTGGDEINPYLRANLNALKARPKNAPVVVIWDHDKADSLVKDTKKFLIIHPNSFVIKLDKGKSNPDLDDSFGGIEKFLSTSIIESAENAGLIQLRRPTKNKYPLGVLGLRKKDKPQKNQLADYVTANGKPEDFKLLIPIVDSVIEQIRTRMSEV